MLRFYMHLQVSYPLSLRITKGSWYLHFRPEYATKSDSPSMDNCDKQNKRKFKKRFKRCLRATMLCRIQYGYATGVTWKSTFSRVLSFHSRYLSRVIFRRNIHYVICCMYLFLLYMYTELNYVYNRQQFKQCFHCVEFKTKFKCLTYFRTISMNFF